MVELEKAIAYVQAHGDTIEQGRLASVLWGKPPQELVLEKLAEMQNPDGGFTCFIKDFSTVCDTVYVLIWFDDLSLHSSPLVECACSFLLLNQKDDGGWDEIERVKEVDAPPFLAPGEIATRVWLTAYCAHWLVRFGYAEHPKVRGCPGRFLEALREPSGRLAGTSKDMRAMWDWLVLLSHAPGEDSELFRQTLALIEEGFSDRYSPERWEGSYLAWLLCCLRDAGLRADHHFVRRCLAELVKKQRADGSWDSEDGEKYASNATVEALRVLKHCGVV